jgi:hypothetical protein
VYAGTDKISIVIVMSKHLSHCAHEVYTHDRDRFYLGLFVPAPAREGLYALYALNVELSRIHTIITEEMIGHVRLAWWQEAIDKLYAGSAPKGQPVLAALSEVIDAGHMPQAELTLLLESYREHFPTLPPDIEALMEKISLVYLELTCPQAKTYWRKAHSIITRHRHRHGKRRNAWLSFKLLLANGDGSV